MMNQPHHRIKLSAPAYILKKYPPFFIETKSCCPIFDFVNFYVVCLLSKVVIIRKANTQAMKWLYNFFYYRITIYLT